METALENELSSSISYEEEERIVQVSLNGNNIIIATLAWQCIQGTKPQTLRS